ncbi:hypothetical protein CLOP_g25671, partial [Closterium sp. NIES-67]
LLLVSIVVPHVGNLRNDIIEEVHSTKYGGHLGIKKTRWALSDVYWWPGLGTEVPLRCVKCVRNKLDTKKPGGLLQPLEIPDKTWESVSLDFITDLPKTRDGHTAILVFVDRLTKMVHFVATTTYVSAEDTAKLFVAHVFRLHGLPRVLVSDRDPRFTSRFWHEVTRTLGTKLKMSSAFHPQTDGQTERTNRTLEQILRSFIGPTQDDWDDLLPVVEFAVNNSVHEGTHEKPFILNCGRHPTTPATHGIGGLRVPAAKDFEGKQQEALKSARRWLQLSQQRQKSYADMKRREVSFEVGDKVLLSTMNIRLKIHGARKLFPRWIGPFEFQDILPNDLPHELPPYRTHQYEIVEESNSKPTFRTPYRLSPTELDDTKKQIEYLFKKGLIRPSTSPYDAPVLFTPKPNKSLCMCIDYRALNKQAIKNKY